MASEILHLSFNQDHGCFACGTNSGFRVYNCDPFKTTFCRGFNNGGIGIVEMLFRCNILAIVGGGPAPKYPPTKVMIWDDHQGKCIGELSFRSKVHAVKLRKNRIVVALEHKVLVYNFGDLKLLHQIETLANPRGLVSISSAAESTVLATPGLHTGQIRIELYDRKQTKFISAHNNPLCCLTLSLDGKRLASASERGTLVRVWNTADGQLLQELRRGADPALVYSIAFSRACDWLAVTSDKSTVHVFALGPQVATSPTLGSASPATQAQSSVGHQAWAVASGPGDPNGHVAAVQQQRANPTSILSSIKGFVPSVALPKYFSSEWSFAQFRLSHDEGVQSIVGFGAEPNSLIIVTVLGSLYKVSFNPAKGGYCNQEAFTRFLEPFPMSEPL